LDAVIAASRMMHESVGKLHDAWSRAQHAVAELQTTMMIERMRNPQQKR
jgi:hypothetical protein